MKLVKKYGGGVKEGKSTIPDWARPYLEKSLISAEKNLEAGNLDRVAGLSSTQLQAIDSAKRAAELQGNVGTHSSLALDQLGRIAAGQDIVPGRTTATDEIKAAAAHQAAVNAQPGIAAAAARGTVGGARNLIQAGAGQNDFAAKLAGLDYADLQQRRQAAQSAAQQAIQGGAAVQDQLGAGANTLKGIGQLEQVQQQKQLDAPYQGLSRYSSLIQGTPWQSQQHSAGGK